MVTKEEYKSYISIREKLEDLAYDIIKYTKANYPKLLEFEEHSGLDDIIVKDNELLLGTWQGIYFAEFDGPRHRRFYVKIIED